LECFFLGSGGISGLDHLPVSIPATRSISAPQRLSLGKSSHVQGDWLRFAPHVKQSPAQSSRHTGFIGAFSAKYCLIASLRSKT
jgi:hypothetical protein